MDEKRLMNQLKQCLSNFVNQVDPIQILPYLPCLSRTAQEEIRAKQDNKGKIVAAQDLYSHIIRYKEKGIKQLLVALRDEEIGLEDLADLIDPPSTKDNTDNGRQTDRNNRPIEVMYERLPGPGNPMGNMGPIHVDPIHIQGNQNERKVLPAPEQHIGRDPYGPGKDNSMQNGGNKNPNEVLDTSFSRPINPTETAGPIPLSPRQGKENTVVEKRELDLPGPEQYMSRGGSGSGEGIDKNTNNLMNKDNGNENSVESTERSLKIHSHEMDAEDVICLEVKTNIEKVIVRATEEQVHRNDECDLENPSTSTESEESNSQVDSSSSNHNLQADSWNNYQEFHKEKHHNKDVLTSEIKKEEENNIHKVEKQGYKNDVEQQPDQNVHVETQSNEMVPTPNGAFSSIMSEEENTSSDSKQMNERKKCTDETMGEGHYVPVPTERVSMETNKPMTSTFEFQVCQKGKRFPDEHVIEREHEPSTAKRFTNDTIDQMSVGHDGKQRPKTILNEQMAGIKDGQTTSSLLPEEHQGFDSLGFVPMTIEDHRFVPQQGSTFSHEIDTVSHQDNASSQQSKAVSHSDAEEVNTPAKLVDIPAAQKDTNVKRDNGFQAMDDIQILQSSSVQGGNSPQQQNDNGYIRSSAQRSGNVNYGGYFIIGLCVVIGAYFIVRRVKKSS
ncbi:hypothetical protein ACJMK2_006173 [Sinanodonta woodiana]|uniref:Caspase recruitment domain-containing protein n=1 Tax=Sinanodonta woodiana TaxID=1069815 RepID=A0ABD3VSS8_SINWO